MKSEGALPFGPGDPECEPHVQEQWSMSITPEARSEMEKFFRSGRAKVAPRADPELIRKLSGTVKTNSLSMTTHERLE